MRSSTLSRRWRERRSTVVWRNAIHSSSICRSDFCVGLPSRPTIVRLIGDEVSRLVCASSVVISSAWLDAAGLGLEHQAHRRVLARLVAHHVQHRQHGLPSAAPGPATAPSCRP